MTLFFVLLTRKIKKLFYFSGVKLRGKDKGAPLEAKPAKAVKK
jgi:hypothetical protein